MKRTGADIIVKMLAANGVSHVFGVPGGHLLKFYDALYHNDTVIPVLTKHESGASFMATGFAQVSNKMGACTGTVGPGATNLVTGVASAYMDSVPLIIITAQVGLNAIGKGGLQEATGIGRTVDHVEIFNGISKSAERVLAPNKLRDAVRNALRTAQTGRPGPAHIDVMANIFNAELDLDETALEEVIRQHPFVAPDEEIDKAAALLVEAKNPVILVGAGALTASKEIRTLVESLNIPLATTLRAKGILPEDHELSLGCVGLYGTNVANKYLRTDIDVLLAVGTSFSEFTTHAWDKRFQPETALIQIDIDPWEIGKNYAVSAGLVGDTRMILNQLLSSEQLKSRKNVSDRIAALEKMKSARDYFSDKSMDSDSSPTKHQRFMKSLRENLPRDAIVFGDIGNTLPWLEAFFQVLEPDSFYICSSLASMGYGVSASIGPGFCSRTCCVRILKSE